jgi:acetyl-CoA carboxylase carboxyltransferase component
MFVEHDARDLGMDGKFLHGDGVFKGTDNLWSSVAVFAQEFYRSWRSLGSMHARKIKKS